MKNTQYQFCKLCQSDQLRMVYTSRNNGLAIKHCESCGLFFVDKVFSEAEQQSIYQDESMYRSFVEGERSVPAVTARYKDWIHDIKRQSSQEEYSQTAQKPRLLDIGCGAGDFLAVAREHGFEVCGLDPAAPAALMAGESHGIHVDVAAIEDYPRDQFFDVATAIGVLEHVIDPKSMLAHMHRLLAPRGLVFIYTPVWGMYDVLTSFLARVSQGRFTRPIDRRINAFHLQIFPKATLTKLLHNLDFDVVSCEAVCEYNVPVKYYLQSVGINQVHIQKLVAGFLNILIGQKLFFRNNMRVIAKKS